MQNHVPLLLWVTSRMRFVSPWTPTTPTAARARAAYFSDGSTSVRRSQGWPCPSKAARNAGASKRVPNDLTTRRTGTSSGRLARSTVCGGTVAGLDGARRVVLTYGSDLPHAARTLATTTIATG